MYAESMITPKYPPILEEYLTKRGISPKIAFDAGLEYKQNYELNEGKFYSGLYIPYYSENGELVHERIRNLPLPNPDFPKFLSPRDKRNYPYLFPSHNWQEIFKKPSKEIIITEGETRAITLCSHGLNAIGLNGCWGFKCRSTNNSSEIFNDFLPEFNKTIKDEQGNERSIWRNRSVGLCFDADIINNPKVRSAIRDLADFIRLKGGKPYLILIPVEDGKDGVDDFIAKHGIKAFEELKELCYVLHNQGQGFFNWEKVLIDRENKIFEFVLKFKNFEPHISLKTRMAWAVLKEKWEYRPGLGWHRWNGIYWEEAGNGKTEAEAIVKSDLQNFINKQNWIKKSVKDCYEELYLRKNNWSIANREWNNKNWLGFQNGYLNLKTNEFIPPNRKHYLTTVLPFNYQSKQNCPKWLEFIKFATNEDPQKIQYLRAWMKWVLIPKESKPYPIEATLWLIGKSRTGKSTFLEVLRGLCGEQNVATIEPEKLNTAEYLYSCFEKKLTFNTDCAGYLKDPQIYNKITSNELVDIRKLCFNMKSARLNTVTVFAMNNELTFNTQRAEGFAQRVHSIYFNRKPNKINPNLKKELEQELPYIFSWVWALSDSEMETLLKNPIGKDVNKVLENSHIEITFLKEKQFYNNEYQSSILYREFKEWCEENGHWYKQINSREFNKLLMQIKGVKRISKNKGNFYYIPDLMNIDLFNNNSQLELNLEKKYTVDDKRSTQKSSGGSIPCTEKVVEQVEDTSNRCKKNKKDLEEKNKEESTLSSTSSTNHIEKGIEPSTLSSTNRPKNQFCYIDEIEHLPNDVIEIFNTAKTFTDLHSQLGAKIAIERKILKKSKEWARKELWDKFQSDFHVQGFGVNKIQKSIKWGNFINHLRSLSIISDSTEGKKNKPILATPDKKEALRHVRNNEKPKPPQTDILSDLLPHLERGESKKKDRYICPCCNQNTLIAKSKNGTSYLECFANCGTLKNSEFLKACKDFLMIKDSKWIDYKQKCDEWEKVQQILKAGDSNG